MSYHFFNMVCTWKILFEVLSLSFPLGHPFAMTHPPLTEGQAPPSAHGSFPLSVFFRAALKNSPNVTPWEPNTTFRVHSTWDTPQRRASTFPGYCWESSPGIRPSLRNRSFTLPGETSQSFPMFLQFPSLQAALWKAGPSKVSGVHTHFLLGAQEGSLEDTIKIRFGKGKFYKRKENHALPWAASYSLDTQGWDRTLGWGWRCHWYVLRFH